MSGPYLYDEGPEALHTGTPRRRNGLLLGIFGGTVALAVAMVVALPLVKGSGEEQAREAVGVFLAALQAGDTETAGDLLCQAERDRGAVGDVLDGYEHPGDARVVGVADGRLGDQDSQEVRVRWDDGAEATLSVVLEDGPRVCGTSG
ncbi:Rv0361 family membrane protein [Geodermatophilus sp. SYSU D01036]